jgi:single-strand DNA-binding protein
MLGHLTRDIELAFTPSQTAYAKGGIAVTEKYKDIEDTCFIDWVAWGKTAETLHKYLHKGDPVFLIGKLRLEQWTAQDGTKRSRHIMNVRSFVFMPKKNQAATQSPQQSPAERDPGQDDDLPW